MAVVAPPVTLVYLFRVICDKSVQPTHTSTSRVVVGWGCCTCTLVLLFSAFAEAGMGGAVGKRGSGKDKHSLCGCWRESSCVRR